MKNWFKNWHTAGVLSALTTVAGIVASPAAAGLLPPKVATGVALTGVVLAAFTKPVNAGNTDLVPKVSP